MPNLHIFVKNSLLKIDSLHTKREVILFILLFFILGCSSTRHVPKDSYLLNKVKLNIDDRRIDEKDAKYYIKQKANTTIFSFLKLNLAIYNMSGSDESKKMNKFLRRVGEAPVLYDSTKTHRTLVQLRRFMQNKGFYKSQISATPVFTKKKVKILYNIIANEPKRIAHITKRKDSLNYKVIGRSAYYKELDDDTFPRKELIKQEGSNIAVGKLFDIDKLKEERANLASIMKNKGYYRFSEDNIHFYIDTTTLEKGVNLSYGLRAEKKRDTLRYRIEKIVVNLLPQNTLNKEKSKIDSTYYEDVLFLHDDNMPYKYKMLRQSILIKKGDWFSPKAVSATKKNLTELQQFQYIGVRFTENTTNDNRGILTCYIQLKQSPVQSYEIEATSTFNSGNLGFRQGLFYKHKNLLKGAEIFNIRFLSGFEQLDKKNFDIKEYGAETRLTTPKFFLPWLKAENWRAKSPRTIMSIIFNYNKRPEYKRTIFDINFSYKWRDKNLKYTHILTPIDIGVLKVEAKDDFLQNLNDYYRKTSYVDHIISSSRYSMIYNNSGKTRRTTFQRLRFNIELAGNFLNLVNNLSESKEEEIEKTGNTNKFQSYFGIRYAQYFKTELDFTYNQFIDRNNALIYHISGGVGIPYGNSDVMPFEKMYFLGGANSMRAWASRSLGPGSSKNNTPSSRISYGEIKIEANLEYRFNVIDKFEGALFFDAGNVWNISESLVKKDELGAFKWNNFYNQIAIGSGLGIRIDISNIILRLDAGIKLVDPYLDSGKKFVLSSKEFNFDDISFNFGIGYPF